MEHDLIRDPLWKRAVHPDRTVGGFKTVQLNVIGWSALLAAGLAVGGVVVMGTDVPGQAALPAGVLLVWGVLLLLDHRRWANSTVGMGTDGLNETSGAEIVARLQEMGITATYLEQTFDDEDGLLHIQRSIVARVADGEAVRTVMGEILRHPL